MRSNRVCNRKIGIARLTPGDSCIPTRALTRPSRPYGKRSSSRSFRRAAACSAGASVTPPVTPAWLQSPEHLRRPGDFRSYCHAPARLWPSKPSTDSLKLTHPLARPRRPSVPDRRPAHALKRKAVTVGSRQTLRSSPWRSFRSRFSVCQPCRFNSSQPPKGGAITPGLRWCFESPPVPGSAS